MCARGHACNNMMLIKILGRRAVELYEVALGVIIISTLCSLVHLIK